MNIPCILRPVNLDACLKRLAAPSTCSAFLVTAVLASSFSPPAAARQLKNQVSSLESPARAEPLAPNPLAKNLAMPAPSNRPGLDSSSRQKVANEAAATSLISSVTIAPAEERISVRVGGKGRLEAQVVWLHDPERLVLDFAGTKLDLQERVIQSDGAPIRSLRLEQYQPNVARLVINLTVATRYEVAHDGSSFVIYLGTQVPNSRASSGNAISVAPAPTNPTSGTQPPEAASSGRNESVLADPTTREKARQALAQPGPGPTRPQKTDPLTPGATTATNSQAANRILTPFGEMNAPAAPVAQGNPPSKIGRAHV